MNQQKNKTYETHEYRLDFDQVQANAENIIKEMGYPKGKVPPGIPEMVDELLEEAKNHIQFRCGFVWLPPGNISGDGGHLYLKNTTFNTERIVGVPLRRMEEAVLFLGTIGPGFDKWSRGTFNGGDPLSGFIIDLLGSELAERMADWLENKVITRAKKEDKKCSNRYSPGYCGWSVAEQQKLFGFFPKDFCGISLTDSSLMKPHKSVSGVIGISPIMKRMEYPCEVCRISHCYKNRNKT